MIKLPNEMSHNLPSEMLYTRSGSVQVTHRSYEYDELGCPYTRENADGTRTVITADYDSMGRRAWKKVESITPNPETGEETTTVTLHHRYIYRGYLQIATCDLTRTAHPCLWLITWDPTQQIAIRPLAIQKDGTWYCYGWDLTKNICEIYSTTVYIRTVYTYTPYGEVTSSGNVTQSPRGFGGGLDKPKGFAPQGRGRNGVRPSQPIQWSSEYADMELGLVYYNYRYYNPTDGRWTRRDPIGIEGGVNLYQFLYNSPLSELDVLGTSSNEDIMNHFLSALPDAVGIVALNTRVAVWPVPVFPIVTVELYIIFNGNIEQCCKQNGTKGLMATGFFGAEISGGIGSSVGGTSNVRTEKGKYGPRYRNGRGGGTGRGGTFSKAPTVGNYGINQSTSSATTSIQNKTELPKCETSLEFTITVGISGFISGGAGFLSFGYQFDTTFGQCKIPGGCSFVNPLKGTSAGAVYGMGTGMRISAYGRAGVDGKLEIS